MGNALKQNPFVLLWHTLAPAKEETLFYILCVVIGLASCVGVTATSNLLTVLVDQNARALLAADVRLQATHPMDDFIQKEVLSSGAHLLAHSQEFTAMVSRADNQGEAILVDVKAVDDHYPVRGGVALASGENFAEKMRAGEAVAEEPLFTRLHLALGQSITLGARQFVLQDRLSREPDRLTTLFRLGPRVIIPLERVAETGLRQLGSRIQYVVSVGLAEGENPEEMASRWQSAALAQGIQITTPMGSQKGAKRFIQRLNIFLQITSLLVLMLSGIGLAGAASNYMAHQGHSLAVLKYLGAGNRLLMWAVVGQLLKMAGLGSLMGAVLGGIFSHLLFYQLGDLVLGGKIFLLPWELFCIGVGFGLLVSLLFSLSPILRIRSTSVGSLLRSLDWELHLPDGRQERWIVAGVVLLLAIFMIYFAGQWRFGSGFLLGLTLCVVLLGLLAWMGLAILEKINLASPIVMLARDNLLGRRRGSMAVLVGLGVGFAVVMTIILLEHNLSWQMEQRLAERAPDFFFMDLQTDQVEPFQQLLEQFVEQKMDLRLTPVVRGRLVRLRGELVTTKMVQDNAEGWRLQREYVLTWSAQIPRGNRLVAGEWWSAATTEDGVSLEKQMADALGIGVGDAIAFDIQGVVVTALVKNIRQVDWSDMGLNFFVVFSPNLLAEAPTTWLATAAVRKGAAESLRLAMKEQFSNVSIVPTQEVMALVQNILVQVSWAAQSVATLAFVAGLLVLGVSVVGDRRRHFYQTALFRLLGATKGSVLKIICMEYALLATVAITFGLCVAQGVSFLLVWWILQDFWVWFPMVSVVGWGIGIVLVIGTGWITQRAELDRPLQRVLSASRNGCAIMYSEK
ncbi:MAG: ABC transporter permease [Magnetococcus sp. DMHC-6]